MSLAGLFGAMVVLWQAEQRGHRVYVHCAAGVNRSQTTAGCYEYLRTGRHRKLQFLLFGSRDQQQNQLQHNCQYGVLPELSQMESWLKRVGEQLPVLDGGSFDYTKPPCFN